MIHRIQEKLAMKKGSLTMAICFRLPSGERLEDLFDPNDSTKVCSIFPLLYIAF